VGTTLVNILQGGSDFSPRLLTVSYMLHILVLPLFLLAVIALHVYLIQVHGMHEPEAGHARPGKKGIRPVPFYPDFMKRISLFWVILLNGVVLLALFLPPELGEPADRLGQTPIGVKPEWYFLFLYQTLKVIPSRILFLDGEMAALLLVFLGALFLFAFPFLGDGLRSGRGGRLARAGVLLFFIYIVVMGIWGHLSQPLALP
jgi:quinol-cytochrome oxidoreductase complex cytochrome b subunit